jgi:hypothetical protein
VGAAPSRERSRPLTAVDARQGGSRGQIRLRQPTTVGEVEWPEVADLDISKPMSANDGGFNGSMQHLLI